MEAVFGRALSHNRRMADGYFAVLAVTASGGEHGDRVERALRDAGASTVVRAHPGWLVFAPPGSAAHLAGPFVDALTSSLWNGPELRLGLAVGMCHEDEHGWYGETVSTARRMAEAGVQGGAVTLAAPEGVIAAMDDTTRRLFRGTGGLLVRGSTASEPTVAGEVAVRTGKTDPIAQVVDDIAAQVAAFADDLPTLLSPSVAPHDVLAWMYAALGVDAPRLLDDDQGHRLLPGLVRCYQRRGTRQGLEELLRLRYGIPVEVVDPGGTSWSTVPTMPEESAPAPVTIVLDTDEPLAGLDEVISRALPVTTDYRVVRRAPQPARWPGAETADAISQNARRKESLGDVGAR